VSGAPAGDGQGPPAAAHWATRAVFTATIFLSALLLFSVQPMFARMVLPTLGGAPAVWAVSMCFFQALLLLGYAYAHVLEARAPAHLALPLHLAVLAVALLALPVAMPARAGAVPDNAYLQLIAILAVGVGLPFFALAANAPLLQAWFARADQIRGADAYALYRASNAGSLAALAAYPVLIEPLLPLKTQSRIWGGGFVALVIAIAACGYLARNARPFAPLDLREPAAGAIGAAHTSWRQRATWAFLAFVPSGLLVAFTTYVTTDLASAPLLWVIPLAIYLATFIAAFRPQPPAGARPLGILQPVSVALTLALMEWDMSFAWVLACAAGTLAFTVTSLLLHRELYERRPDTARLTDFYLWLSAGGALGGVFSALLAPHLFSNVLEFPLLLVAGLLWRFSASWPGMTRQARQRLVAALAAAAALVLLSAFVAPWTWTPTLRFYALAGLAAAMIAALRWPLLEQTAALALALAVAVLPNGNRPVHAARSFYGTHKVIERPGTPYRVLLHGVTLHGAQRITPEGSGARPVPLTYYHPSGPLARGLSLARAAAGGPSRPLRVGIVGLGTGAMACHAVDGDRWRFFELDPEVIGIASNPAYFTYLRACQPDARIVAGDARLTIAREAPASFDYLVIDAFSSDAIPIHLLTVEAIALYARLLSPRGVLAMHVSNQNLDLTPVVESNLARIGGLAAVYAQGESGGGAIRSQVVLVARDAAILAPALAWPKARRLDSPTVRPWTDDYSDILSSFLRRLRAKLGEALAE
jgi:hypothetical protein